MLFDVDDGLSMRLCAAKGFVYVPHISRATWGALCHSSRRFGDSLSGVYSDSQYASASSVAYIAVGYCCGYVTTWRAGPHYNAPPLIERM